MKVNQLLKPLVLLLFLLNYVFGVTQNVGIGTSNPLNPLHVVGSTNVMLRLVSTNSFASEISFYTADGLKGYVGAYNNTLEVAAVALEPVTLLTSGTQRMIVTAGGNVGIGSLTAPAEKLTIQSGNILLSNADKGIILNGADRPMITRGFDPFISGNYTGIGRWGMFMEPNRLVLGVPNLSDKAIEFAGYNTNSSRSAFLTIQQSGKVNRPATGGTDLLPIAIGNIRWDGVVNGGSGNFSVEKVGTGIFYITLNGITYTETGFVTIATVSQVFNNPSFVYSDVATGGRLALVVKNDSGTLANQDVHFIVYRL